jgi:hypothetical protein
MDTAADANICQENQTLGDCVLIYNSKIIMSALLTVCCQSSHQIHVLFIIF